MTINSSPLNSAALNSSAQRGIFAFADIDASANLSSEAIAIRMGYADIAASANLSSAYIINNAASALIEGDATILAVNPTQQFASSVVVAAIASQTADALVTRYVESDIDCSGLLSGSAWLMHTAAAYADAFAELSEDC